MYQVVHIASECYPIAKTGGLGDVVGALPKYLNRAGVNSCAILPFYNLKWNRENEIKSVFKGQVFDSHYSIEYTIHKVVSSEFGFDIYLLDIQDLLYRENIYGYDDDPKRFLFFQLALLDWMETWDILPKVFHCHDHHSGLIPFLIKHAYRFSKLKNIRTICTIHNGLYTGTTDWSLSNFFPDFSFHDKGLLDWDNQINPLAASIKCCDFLTTVSEGYLDELKTQNHSMQWLYNEYAQKSKGIVNGIDWEVWNPETDVNIAFRYKKDWKEFKQKNKEIFCLSQGLNPDLPLMIFIGRFVKEKGGEVLPHAIAQYVSQSPNMNFYVLGSGILRYEEQIKNVVSMFNKNVGTYIGYNESLAHQLYAAADFLIMPSEVEPCGLNQLYAMRYAAVPLVMKVGGLKDTVIDMDSRNGYGLCFEEVNVAQIVNGIKRAVKLYNDKVLINKVRNSITDLNFSWESAVKQYIEIYNQ